jgi:hypothetical protein
MNEDWERWTDRLVFREEQRAIGEAMLQGTGPSRTLLGYGAFKAAILGKEPVLTQAIQPAMRFVLNTAEHLDFRRVRFRELAFHLVELIEELHPQRVPDHMRKWKSNVSVHRDPARRWLDVGSIASPEHSKKALA